MMTEKQTDLLRRSVRAANQPIWLNLGFCILTLILLTLVLCHGAALIYFKDQSGAALCTKQGQHWYPLHADPDRPSFVGRFWLTASLVLILTLGMAAYLDLHILRLRQLIKSMADEGKLLD